MHATLILYGEADSIVAEARSLAEMLPNAKLSVLPGAGHVPTLMCPLAVAHEIMNFFAPALWPLYGCASVVGK